MQDGLLKKRKQKIKLQLRTLDAQLLFYLPPDAIGAALPCSYMSSDRDPKKSRQVINGKSTPLKQNFVLGVQEVKMDGSMILPKAMDLRSRENFPGSETGVRENIYQIRHLVFSFISHNMCNLPPCLYLLLLFDYAQTFQVIE
jgi:hypothetical protein